MLRTSSIRDRAPLTHSPDPNDFVNLNLSLYQDSSYTVILRNNLIKELREL